VETVNRLINEENVHVIIGAGASSITKAVLPTVLAAGVVLFSPCNTAAELSTIADQGLYFRTAPPDNLQAAALTDIIMRDGVRRVAIIAREDAYGRGLMDAVQKNLIAAGLDRNDVSATAYDPANPDFDSLGPAMQTFQPDGVLIIGFDETAKALDVLLKSGFKSIVN
jgi:ABC-type branched-subunit amino acid transport system substrate-binding protein